ncbi:MAG: DHH family phosphoesterase [Patescibacteria group bacterium]|jgi:phosphoesterase RecJ-like protein
MENHKTSSENIRQEINKAKDILLLSHKKPDGDTLGANLAMLTYLKAQNKNVTSFCLDPLPSIFEFLPNSHFITNDHRVFSKKYDLVIVLDSGSLEYAGIDKLLTALPPVYILINIDHHISNPNYGDINLVIHEASSTCEVIYRLLKDWNINWTSDIATNINCGIITDTNGFTNAATNYKCLYAASEMIKQGAQVYSIIKNTLNNNNVSNLRIWGRALERLRKSSKHDIVYTWLSQADFKECEVDERATEGIVNFLHILKDAKILMVLTEMPNNTIKGSLRTVYDIDLTKLAGLFGGGGHKKAAGFSLPGRLVYDKNKLKII